METEEQDCPLPNALPVQPEQCHSLKQWIELGLGLPQHEIARLAGTSQGRISLVVNGQMPRRKHWPALLKALSLIGHEPLFYRWIVEARLAARQRAELKRGEVDPLFGQARADEPGQVIDLDVSANLHAPAGKSVRGA